jgi:aryl-alcohol dehydrogenase-like predicted oxidoreductase
VRRNMLRGTSLELSEIGFGCGRLATLLGPGSTREASLTLTEAYDRGITFYDTADLYGQGRSEELLGRTFGSKRHSIVIATKAGYQVGNAASLGAKVKPLLRPFIKQMRWLLKVSQRGASPQKQQDFSPGYLAAAIERSLRRLRTDYIDLFLLHSPDPSVVQAAVWKDALERAKEQGKIRFYGVSCRETAHAAACMRVPGVSCVQIPLNLIEREGIESLLYRAADANFGLLARQPLASGMLAKPSATLRAQDFPWDGEEFEQRLSKIRAIPRVGDNSYQCVQAAFRYVLQLNGIDSVILGMSSRDHLRYNLQAIAEAVPETTTGRHV